MHRLTLICLLVLLGCGHRPTALPPNLSPAFRDPAAPIYSSAVLDPARIQGHWVQVAGFGTDPACGPGVVDIGAGNIDWSLCLGAARSGAGPLLPGKPGRFAVPGMPDWWVLWADGDYRTLVIGTPSGQFGFVLNRDASLPADRAKAVRDILKFNGYNLDTLRFF